jgi:hypothetical protein
MCPKGDDPLTINQNFRSIQWDVYVGQVFRGKVGLEFQGTKVYLPFEGISSEYCSDLLSFSGKFGLVGCKFISNVGYHMTFELTFYNWPIYPKDNNLFINNGNPSIYEFFCDITYANPSTKCTFSDLISDDVIGMALFFFVLRCICFPFRIYILFKSRKL